MKNAFGARLADTAREAPSGNPGVVVDLNSEPAGLADVEVLRTTDFASGVVPKERRGALAVPDVDAEAGVEVEPKRLFAGGLEVLANGFSFAGAGAGAGVEVACPKYVEVGRAEVVGLGEDAAGGAKGEGGKLLCANAEDLRPEMVTG